MLGRGRAGRCPGLEGPLRGPLRRGKRLFNGKVQLSVFDGQQLDLDRLPLLKKIVDIIDIGVGDLGDMYKAGPAALQGYEGAEFCDAGDLAL